MSWVLLDGESIDCPPLLYCPECWENGNLSDSELYANWSKVAGLPRLPLIMAVLKQWESHWFCSHCHRQFDMLYIGPTLAVLP